MADIPEDKIKEFAFNHGNQFHGRVAALLRKNHWDVLVSPYYRDNATDKAREADIIAEREFIMHGPGGAYRGGARVRLIAECKYIATPIVFWFDGKDLPRAEKRITDDTVLGPRSGNVNIDRHHWYDEKRVAKLFATYSDGVESKQPENEVMFGAVDKVLNALISYRTIDSIIPVRDRREQVWPKLPTYPIIVCNDFSKFYLVPFDGSDRLVKFDSSIQYFQVEVNYAYTRFVSGMRQEIADYFLVDVVNFNFLREYLDTFIQGDVNAMGKGDLLYVQL
jgi:hypothetical protein